MVQQLQQMSATRREGGVEKAGAKAAEAEETDTAEEQGGHGWAAAEAVEASEAAAATTRATTKAATKVDEAAVDADWLKVLEVMGRWEW